MCSWNDPLLSHAAAANFRLLASAFCSDVQSSLLVLLPLYQRFSSIHWYNQPISQNSNVSSTLLMLVWVTWVVHHGYSVGVKRMGRRGTKELRALSFHLRTCAALPPLEWVTSREHFRADQSLDSMGTGTSEE